MHSAKPAFSFCTPSTLTVYFHLYQDCLGCLLNMLNSLGCAQRFSSVRSGLGQHSNIGLSDTPWGMHCRWNYKVEVHCEAGHMAQQLQLPDQAQTFLQSQTQQMVLQPSQVIIQNSRPHCNPGEAFLSSLQATWAPVSFQAQSNIFRYLSNYLLMWALFYDNMNKENMVGSFAISLVASTLLGTMQACSKF